MSETPTIRQRQQTALERRREATRVYRLRRRRFRIAGLVGVVLLITAMVISRLPKWNRGDDWAIFNHQTFSVIAVIDGETVRVSDGPHAANVRMLGITTAGTKDELTRDALGERVTLLLWSPQTRERDGRLRAYAFLGEDNLSAILAKAGAAYADRRETDPMAPAIIPAEADARKHRRGLWATVKFDQFPSWRKDWIRSLPKHEADEVSRLTPGSRPAAMPT